MSDTLETTLPPLAEALTSAALSEALREIQGHLGAALMQAQPSDDQRIIGHIRSAYAIARTAMLQRRAMERCV